MNFNRVLILALYCILFAVGLIVADNVDDTAPGSFETAISQGRNFLSSYIDENTIPGLSVAVAANGRIVWSEGFGNADLENRLPVTPATRFRIGSVSKPFTSLLTAILADRRKIRLDGRSPSGSSLAIWQASATIREMSIRITLSAVSARVSRCFETIRW